MKQFSSIKEAMKCTFTGRRQSCGSIMPVQQDRSQSTEDMMTMSIPTFFGGAKPEEVDISQYTPDDLERLRLEDPFLYYSIPGMKQKLYEYGSETSSKHSTSRGNALSRSFRRSSCPTILLTKTNDSPGSDGQQAHQRRGSVTRARRLSVEPHPSVVMKSIMDEMNIDYDSDSDLDEEDEELIKALSNGSFFDEQ